MQSAVLGVWTNPAAAAADRAAVVEEEPEGVSIPARLIIQSDVEPAILALVAAVGNEVIADGSAEHNCVPDDAEELTRVQWSC